MKYNETLKIEDIETLTLITINADLRVKQVAREELFYDVILGDDYPEYKPIINRLNKNLEIRFQKKSNKTFLDFLNLRSFDVEKVYVEVPEDKILNLVIKKVSGNVELENLNVSSLNFSGVSGELECENITADKVSISLVSGDVNLDGLNSKKINLSSVSGDVKINRIAEAIQEISGSTVSGDIDLDFEIKNQLKYL
ncbi:MAG: hypothetical protein PWQ20_602 [Thermotogaceae bacterium]|nr:hypothetical protein [Thermotogaceae bacterium]